LLLQEHGYRTLMTTANSLTTDRSFGFQDVFWRFNATSPYHFRLPSFEPFAGFYLLKNWLRFWRIFRVLVFSPEHSTHYFEAPRINETIKREIEHTVAGKDRRPFFLYVHYMEPHSPYYRHPHRPVQINIYSGGRRESVLDAYRSEIRAVDQAVADLYAFLVEKGLMDKTYLFISSDHGEEFYDHKNWGHGKSLYPEAIHVPAILALPSGQKKSLRVDTIIESIDIMPTFAELAKVPAPEYWSGHSLVSYFSPEVKRVIKTEMKNGESEIAFSQFDDGRNYFWVSAITGGWQIVFKEPRGQKASSGEELRQKRKIMLFNLAEDPLAMHNLYGQGLDNEKGLVTLLDKSLQDLEATAHVFRGKEEKVDPKLLEQLRALGYVK